MIQTTGLKRNTIDKYYTKNNIVQKCIKNIKSKIKIKKNHLIIEPSAGNGSFIPEIKTIGCFYKFYDIQPENNEIIKQDFLEFDVKTVSKKYIHIIGNPPFGRQSSLAIKFIKKCCSFAESISFILPKSFKKDSMQKYFDINYHLIFEEDLPDNSFVVNNIDSNVPCIFQIWIKKDKPRKLPIKLEPNGFSFVKKDSEPDISFRRVGVYAGKISTEIEDKSIQSHYFIKFNNKNKLSDNLKNIENIQFDFNNTVGPKSISKQELISKFNKCF